MAEQSSMTSCQNDGRFKTGWADFEPLHESFELQTLASLSSAHLAPTSEDDDFNSEAAFPSAAITRAVAGARTQAASILWPSKVFTYAHAESPDRKQQQMSKVRSKLRVGRTSAETPGKLRLQAQPSLQSFITPMSVIMKATIHTLTSLTNLPRPIEELPGKALDTVSNGRGVFDEFIGRNGWGTQDTTPLRRPRYKAGELDPSAIRMPLHPEPCSLPLESGAYSNTAATNATHAERSGRSDLVRASYLSRPSSADRHSVVTAVETLRASQVAEIEAWRNRRRTNEHIGGILRKFGLLPPTFTGGILNRGTLNTH
ncbi:hypothetical protein NliqN6_3285 [Naganishia liquefaciens]|uniref:Uncharacterized protein n=1 Tax=Naganishia liquefaciens TaxID=104408 RepID=A0A8H3TU14_9TREE|nr:hypothetical protein NliqN6_3285 [Naganishia liquefaciens]